MHTPFTPDCVASSPPAGGHTSGLIGVLHAICIAEQSEMSL